MLTTFGMLNRLVAFRFGQSLGEEGLGWVSVFFMIN